MITISDKATAVIKDLIITNNDRYEGYKTAAEEAKDLDLKTMFTRFSNQSNQFGSELKRYITLDESPQDETSASGKVYRAWMDVKAAVSTNDRKAVLSSCEFGEDVALSAYKSALEENEVSAEISMLIRKQKEEILQAHNTVKAMRDAI